MLNVGSSSLKWSVVGLDGEVHPLGGTEPALPSESAGCRARVAAVAARAGEVQAVGHRWVHGGSVFRRAVVIDDEVRAALAGLVELDPLHARPALAAIDAARAVLPGVPHVAAFDTEFHATLPEDAAIYPLPEEWNTRYAIRRYGFHGLSVAYAVGRARGLLGALPRRLVVAHLGSGSSITAVLDGRSIDTTMGMTPLDGMMMATRSGALDPGVVLHLAARGLSWDQIEEGLQHRSGLSTAAPGAGDLREVRRKAEAGDAQARLALAQLLRYWRRTCGAMVGSLGGLDGLVFTGGIGEHDARFRADASLALAYAGLALDEGANVQGEGDRRISPTNAPVAVLVVTAREDLQVAQEIRQAICS